jgi:A/G-specific adenine glycosylase
VPFFERFLQTFPTLTTLAAAGETEVLRLWEGLGYYRRARHLHQAAQHLAAAHSARIPDDPEVFGDLPGVGRYILGAVLSQAFDRRLPILEANTLRLLSRFLGLTEDPRSAGGQRRLWEVAERLLPVRQAGQFNQAMMELGALVCTPTSPRCSSCPLAGRCRAYDLGLQEQIPPRPTAAAIVPVKETAVVAWRGKKVLIAQRPPEGRWAGLWEFPHGPLEPDESHESAAERLLTTLTGIHGIVERELLTLRHAVTRYRITLVSFKAKYQSGEFFSSFYTRGRWVEPRRLKDYPVSAPQRRLAAALLGH